MKKVIMSLIGAALVAFGLTTACTNQPEDSTTSDSVIHVVTVSWKEDASEAQIQAALNGVKTIAKDYDGVTRVWIRSIKAQGDRTHAFVMEFKSEQALKDYTDSPAQLAWYKVYQPVKEVSTTFDITN